MLDQKRSSAKCVLEVEIGFGSSQDPQSHRSKRQKWRKSPRMWKGIFPRARIPVFDFCQELQFEEDRTNTRVVNLLSFQKTTATLKEMHESVGKLDIVVDDGVHTNEPHVQTFDAVFPFRAQEPS